MHKPVITEPLSDIPMFYIEYFTMYKVHVLVCVCTEIIHSPKLVDYLLVHTHKPYNNLHLTTETFIGFSFFQEPACDFISSTDFISLYVRNVVLRHTFINKATKCSYS